MDFEVEAVQALSFHSNNYPWSYSQAWRCWEVGVIWSELLVSERNLEAFR